MNKDLFKDFIENDTNLEVRKIYDFELKDYDDDDGFATEHYIVRCSVSTDININNEVLCDYQFIDKTCLVLRSKFDRYVNSKKSIIWL